MKSIINSLTSPITALLFALPLLLPFSSPLLAGEPPTTPILRINTAMHTAPINAVAVNAEETRFYTASHDKTVKVWDRQSGQLLRTLRVPIDHSAKEGQLRALALDPREQWLAVAGWTGSWDKVAHVYILNPYNGKLLQRLGGLPDVIFGLCVSTDGQRLAATLGGKNGVRQWQRRGNQWQGFARDSNYGDSSYGCAYDGKKQLLTSSLDGYLRLYNPDGKRIEKDKIPLYAAKYKQVNKNLSLYRFFDVKNVAANDTLNIRRGYNYRSDKVGELPYNAQCVVEIRRKGDWSFISFGKHIGWVNNNYLARSDGPGCMAREKQSPHTASGQRVKKIKASHGKLPARVAIHPNGTTFAVGYADRPVVSLGRLSPFAITRAVNTQGLDNGGLPVVAWSIRGDRLYTGGTYALYDSDGSVVVPVIVWNQAGWGKPLFLSGTSNTVMGILPFKGSKLLSIRYDPAWLLQDNRGKVIRQQLPTTLDNSNKLGNDFLLSRDGKQLALGRDAGGKNPIMINLSPTATQPVNAINQLPQAGNKWMAAQTDSLPIRGWKNTEKVQLYGKPINLMQYEMSRSLAIADDQRSFLLGTEWTLRRYQVANRQAKLQWEKDVPAIAWGVNLTPDQRLAVAALGDGTIRWYRYADGEELLALFIDKKTLEWVAWTPQGYYNASIHGDQLIGWHVNRGKDKKPDFFPAAKFRQQFYRPLIVANILETLDIDNAIALANRAGEATNAKQRIDDVLPPAVDIVNLGANLRLNNPQLTLQLDIRSDNSDLTMLHVLADGQRIAKKPISGRSGRYSISVQIPQRDHILSVFAENRQGSSVPVSRRIQWTGKSAYDRLKPTLYVLSIGVADYDDDSLDLQYPSKDAKDFARVMQTQTGLYRDVKVKLLTDPSKSSILDGLDWLAENVTNKDVAMLFFAGHGAMDKYREYQLIGRDAQLSSLHRTGVPADEIKAVLSNLPGKRIAFLDACYSGNLMGSGHRGLSPMINMDAIANELSAVENGVIVFSSSTGKQTSQENARWGNGAFTKALIEGLQGGADYEKKGKITYKFLDAYISERVKKLTHNEQSPTIAVPDSMPDFPIALPK